MSEHFTQDTSDTGTDPSGDIGTGETRLLRGGSFATVAMSVIGSLVSYGILPDQMRIHWTLGLGSYYGPEFAPTWLVLVLFPALILGGALAGGWVMARFREIDGAKSSARPYDALLVVGTLMVMFGVQMALVLLNL